MKLKVGLPCDCRACVNQRNLIAEKMIVPRTSLKLAGLDIVNNLVTTIRSSKTSLQCSWAYFWLLCIHTNKCNFHNNFERTACTSSTNLSVSIHNISSFSSTLCLHVYSLLATLHTFYQTARSPDILSVYSKISTFFGLFPKWKKKVNRQREVQQKERKSI